MWKIVFFLVLYESSALKLTAHSSIAGCSKFTFDRPIITASNDIDPFQHKIAPLDLLQAKCLTAENAFDDDLKTKWVGTPGDKPARSLPSIEYDSSSETVCLTMYTFTSASEDPRRSPSSWKLSGSRDGVHYSLLHYPTDVTFAGRGDTKTFRLMYSGTYSHFRFDFMEAFFDNKTKTRVLEIADINLYTGSCNGKGNLWRLFGNRKLAGATRLHRFFTSTLEDCKMQCTELSNNRTETDEWNCNAVSFDSVGEWCELLSYGGQPSFGSSTPATTQVFLRELGDCHDGHMYKGRCYKAYPDTVKKTFKDAQGACVSWGGNLLTVDSAEEAEWVSFHLRSLNDPARWLGLKASEQCDGSYYLVNNQPVSFYHWKPGSPSNNFENRCAAVFNNGNRYTGQMFYDLSCNTPLAFICEKAIKKAEATAFKCPMHSSCTAIGQIVAKPGTHDADTVCGCKETFEPSVNGLCQCVPERYLHNGICKIPRKCNKWGQLLLKAHTTLHDSVCTCQKMHACDVNA